MFPKTPLIGVYGNGELGISYLPDYKENLNPESSEAAKSSSKRDPRFGDYMKPGQYLHSFTTIFVMVSFGNV